MLCQTKLARASARALRFGFSITIDSTACTAVRTCSLLLGSKRLSLTFEVRFDFVTEYWLAILVSLLQRVELISEEQLSRR